MENIDSILTLIAVAIIPILLFMYKYVKPEIIKGLRYIKVSFAKTPFVGRIITINNAGIVTFFASRDDIELYRRHPSMEEYIIGHASTSFTYIGMWIGESNKFDKLKSCVNQILYNDTTIDINLFFGNPKMDKQNLKLIADHYDTTHEKVEFELERCLLNWSEYKKSLAPNLGSRLKIHTHNCLLTWSIFIFNESLEGWTNDKIPNSRAIIFLDQKLYGCSKDDSFSMEIKYKKNTKNSQKNGKIWINKVSVWY